MKMVEQVNSHGEIELGYDTSLSISAARLQSFPDEFIPNKTINKHISNLEML